MGADVVGKLDAEAAKAEEDFLKLNIVQGVHYILEYKYMVTFYGARARVQYR